MPLKGDINTFSLAAIVRLIHSENKTGTLKVSGSGRSLSLYFIRGKIAFIRSDISDDLSLGALLKSRNIINEDDIRKLMEISGATGKLFEILLIEEGYIPRNKLTGLLRQQFKEVIAAVMAWEKGEFAYADKRSGYGEDLDLEIDPVRLITEAQKWMEYRTLIPNDAVVFKIRTGGFKPDLLSGDSASRVMLLIDGQRSVSQIIAETGLSRPAVYRALLTLASQGAIAREEMSVRRAETNGPDDAAIIKFYLHILHEMTAGLAIELGGKKAAFLAEKSFKHTPYYDLFLGVFQPDADMVTNSDRINRHLRQQKQNISNKDLIKGFNLAIVNLLQEEYQLLGFGSTLNTARQIKAGLESVPASKKSLALNLEKFLDKCCRDEDLLRGEKSLSAAMNFKRQPPSNEAQALPVSSDDYGMATMIAFYGKALQLVAGDLESEIGAMVLDLFKDIAMRSEYYDAFLSQFSIKNDIRSNVQRIRSHIRSKGLVLGRKNMVSAFQQILLGLLQEEHRLLGNKATRNSLLKLKEHMVNTGQENYGLLATQLFEFLKDNTIGTEDTEKIFNT